MRSNPQLEYYQMFKLFQVCHVPAKTLLRGLKPKSLGTMLQGLGLLAQLSIYYFQAGWHLDSKCPLLEFQGLQ